MELQTGLVGLSTKGSQQVVAGATHDMPFEKPDVIVDAIREVLDGSGRLTTSAVRIDAGRQHRPRVHVPPVCPVSVHWPQRSQGSLQRRVAFGGGVDRDISPTGRTRARQDRPRRAGECRASSSPPMTRRSRRIPRPRSTRRPRSGRDRGRDHHGTGRGPRLRQPVRAADRSPRTRARRLLRTAAPRHALRRTRAPRTRAIILSGGPSSVRRGCPQARPGCLVRGGSRSSASAMAPS